MTMWLLKGDHASFMSCIYYTVPLIRSFEIGCQTMHSMSDIMCNGITWQFSLQYQNVKFQ